MRMTNEEFQAEVFRRSAVYQKKRTKRIRIMTGACGFACCLLLTLGITQGFPRLRYAMEYLRADNATSSSAADERRRDDWQTNGADSAEASDAEVSEASEEAADEPENGRLDTDNDATLYHPTDPTFSDLESGVSDESVDESSEEPTVFSERTEEEVLARYGLDPLPEQFGNMNLVTDRSKGYYYGRETLGFQVSENDPEKIVEDANTWVYLGWEPMHLMTVTFFTWEYGDCPPEFSYQDDDENSGTEYAAFAVNGIGVNLSLSFWDQEGMDQVIAEITEYLNGRH